MAEAPAPAKTAVTSGKTTETAKNADTPRKVAGVKDSGQVHTVTKGENPERIAKKCGVSYTDLIKLNRIEDPTKLQIGQKLHLPTKVKATASN